MVANSRSYAEICAELYRRGNFTLQAKTPWGLHQKQLHALQLLTSHNITSIGYGGSGRCFVAGTMVNTINGYIPIELITKGTLVLSENAIGEMEFKPVEKIYQNTGTPKRKMIKFVLNNCEIKSTEHHEYRFKNNWIPGRDIARGVMETRRQHRQSLFGKQHGKIIDDWLQGRQSDFYYEASTGRKRLSKNDDKSQWENINNKNASASSSGFFRKPRKQIKCQSYKFHSYRQSGGEFRVGNTKRKHESFGSFRKNNLEWNITSCIKRRRKPNIKAYRNSSERNKVKIQTSTIYKRNVRQRIWSLASNNKRYNTGPELVAREIKLSEIKAIHFTTENIKTYDLCVSGNYNYVVTEENIKVHNSGKSWVAGEWLTMNCIAYPGTGWGLGRKELKNLKRTTLLTLFKVFAKYKLVFKVDYVYNQQDQIITFKNGSQIFLIDTAYQPNDPLYTRFGGYELTGLVIDESNETQYEAIEILSGRCGFRKNIEYNLPARTLEMFNPDKGHVYSRFYKPYKDGVEQPNRRFIKALPSDNPDPAVAIWVKQQIETAGEITIQRLIHGNFDYDESKDKLIEHEAEHDYFTNAHVIPSGIKYITADIARMGRDSTMIRVWNGYVVIERVEIFKSELTDTAAAIKALSVKHGVGMSKTIVDQDGLGAGVRDILKCHGFVANAKPIGPGNYQNLKTQCTFIISELINARKLYEPCSNNNPSLMSKIKEEMDWCARERGIDDVGKRKIISKDEVKTAIRRSPDEFDSINMRAFFELGTRI